MLDALFSIFYCTLGIGYKNSKMTKLLVTIFLYSLWLTLATAEGVRSGQELFISQGFTAGKINLSRRKNYLY